MASTISINHEQHELGGMALQEESLCGQHRITRDAVLQFVCMEVFEFNSTAERSDRSIKVPE